MEQPVNVEVSRLTPEQRVRRFEIVLDNFKKMDQGYQRQYKVNEAPNMYHLSIKLARGIVEAVLGNDPKPVVEDGQGGLKFGLSEQGGQDG